MDVTPVGTLAVKERVAVVVVVSALAHGQPRQSEVEGATRSLVLIPWISGTLACSFVVPSGTVEVSSLRIVRGDTRCTRRNGTALRQFTTGCTGRSESSRAGSACELLGVDAAPSMLLRSSRRLGHYLSCAPEELAVMPEVNA